MLPPIFRVSAPPLAPWLDRSLREASNTYFGREAAIIFKVMVECALPNNGGNSHWAR